MYKRQRLLKLPGKGIFFFLCFSFLYVPVIYSLELEAALGERRGNIIYQIGGFVSVDGSRAGRTRFPLSELKFDTNTPVVEFVVRQELKNNWQISLALIENLKSGSGELEDSDWGINFSLSDPTAFSRDSLDIYSTSTLKMDAMDFKLDLMKKTQLSFLPDWQLLAGAGVLFQRYNFEAYNTLQQYPSTPEVAADYLDGRNLEYRYRATMPFLSLTMSKEINAKTLFSFSGLYSPLLFVKDYDNHILRDKTSEGDSEGWGLGLSLSLILKLAAKSSLTINAYYFEAVANGTQVQTFKNNPDYSEAEIGLRNMIEQKMISLGFKQSF